MLFVDRNMRHAVLEAASSTYSIPTVSRFEVADFDTVEQLTFVIEQEYDVQRAVSETFLLHDSEWRFPTARRSSCHYDHCFFDGVLVFPCSSL